MSIVFSNRGVISRKAVTAFGVSSKERPGAIGYFGTGLKYAIAILLREGCAVTISSDKEVWRFGLSKRKVRVDTFQFVTLNGRALEFTTELGKNWELWMAFRELYCNVLDEGGGVGYRDEEATAAITGVPGMTTVIVEGERFEEVWKERNSVILQSEPLEKTERVWVHPGPSKYVYYKGVRVHTLLRPSLYTYNIQSALELTEDRTLKQPWMAAYHVQQAVHQMTNRDAITTILTAPRDTFEHEQLDYSYVPVSGTFEEVAVPLVQGMSQKVNRSLLVACRTALHTKMKQDPPTDLSAVDAARLRKAVSFCRRVGYPVDEYPIKTSDFLGEDTLGMAQDGVIFVTRKAFSMGTKQLAGTLVEEFLHLRYGLLDETRAMQNHLMDALVTMGESMLGEPL